MTGGEATVGDLGWSGWLILALFVTNVVVFVGLVREELHERRVRRQRHPSAV